MAKMLLINPRPRRKSRKAPSAAQRRVRAAFAARARSRRRRNPVSPTQVASLGRRRRNPVPALAPRAPQRQARRVARRAGRRSTNPIRSRRRRNPLNLGSASSYIGMLKQALIGGAGALAIDVAYGYVTPYLPASLQRTPGQISVGDAVKAVITIVAGKVLDRPTKGLASQAARGALIVQAHSLLAQLLPGAVTLGYGVPARVANMSNRIGPNRRLARYTAPGRTPLLARYASGGMTPLLNGDRESVMARESQLR